jgi:hypothetical protein
MAATKKEIESWHQDKAVKDNVTESSLCVDCGVNTAPGFRSGPETRIDIALYGKSEHTAGCDHEVYIVRKKLWLKAGMKPWGGCLCVGCLEKRIGRQLTPKDFDPEGDATWANLPCTERLLNRRGYKSAIVDTDEGPKEIIVDIKAFKGIPEGERARLETPWQEFISPE